MSARGPGGRIAPDNRGKQTPGVGANSKRHDLERRDVPFLHGSDLQQGDVQAMEQGQRIAPVQTQGPARPQAPGQPQGQQTSGPQDEVPAALDMARHRLSNTMPPSPDGVPILDQRQRRSVDGWANFMDALARHPTASPLIRARALQQRQAAEQLRRARGASSQVFDLNAADSLLEEVLEREGF